MSIRNYSNTAAQSTLSANIGATDTSIALAGYAGDPTPPFTAALARGTSAEEIVLVTAVVGSTVTVTRGYDGTSAQSQAAGATFQEVVVAADFREANNHVNTVGGAHGVSSQLVGVSDVQTLTNKTLTAPQVSALTGTGTTTLAAVAATTLAVSGASTLTTVTATTLSVSGASTVAALTASGAVKAPTVETTTAVLLDQQASDPATPAPAGQTALWKAANHGLYLVGSTAGKRRLVAHWGAGTTFPTTGVLAGDAYLYTGAGVFVYDGSNWRQGEVLVVADNTARNAIPPAALYAGYKVRVGASGLEHVYDGATWRCPGFLGRYDAPWPEVAGQYSVSPTVITEYTAPDPGVPFFCVATVGLEGGSAAAGSRWDFQFGRGGTGAVLPTTVDMPILLVSEDDGKTRYKYQTSRPITGLSGAITWRLVSNRVYGSGNGQIQSNRTFSVAYYGTPV